MKKKNKKGCATGGNLDLSSLSSLAPLLTAIPGAAPFAPLLAVPGLVQGYMEKKKQDATVVSATPGNYMLGGPLDPTVPPVYSPVVSDPRLTMMTPTVDSLRLLGTTPPPTIPTGRLSDGFASSKSKSNDRFRERAYGGTLDNQLADNSFQVKGNPSVTDGNYYPEYDANLDHNEVVKDNFVFSEKLKDPDTKKSFAQLAKTIENSTGKAQRMLKSNPNDSMARNTVMLNENRSKTLAAKQEGLAQLLGLRNDPTQGYAAGGNMGPGDPPYTLKGDMGNNFFNPMDPTTGRRKNPTTPDSYIGFRPANGQTLIDIGRDGMFYDPYRKEFAVRNSKGEYVPVEPKPGSFTRTPQGEIVDMVSNKRFNPQHHTTTDQAPRIASAGATAPTTTPQTNTLASFNPFAQQAPATSAQQLPPGVSPQTHTLTDAGWVPNTLTTAGGTTPKSHIPSATYKKPSAVSNTNPTGPVNPNYRDRQLDLYVTGNTTPYTMDPMQPLNMLNRNTEYDNPDNPGTTITGPSDVSPQVTSQRSATVYSPSTVDPNTNLGNTVNSTKAGGIGNDWATGDYLQAAKVLSGFGQLIGGYKKEKPNYDNTQITQSVYDPAQALQANQRTYKDALTGYDAPSVNTGRAYANALYANKLGQDAQTTSQYQQMNQQAKQQYETRTADQRRYNVGQTSYTNDINQHNSDAYRMAVDSAFTGLSNFGTELNQKKQSNASLEILKRMHPEIYANVMGLSKKG